MVSQNNEMVNIPVVVSPLSPECSRHLASRGLQLWKTAECGGRGCGREAPPASAVWAPHDGRPGCVTWQLGAKESLWGGGRAGSQAPGSLDC